MINQSAHFVSAATNAVDIPFSKSHYPTKPLCQQQSAKNQKNAGITPAPVLSNPAGSNPILPPPAPAVGHLFLLPLTDKRVCECRLQLSVSGGLQIADG